MWVEIPQRLAHHKAQFNFIMQTDTLGAEDWATSGKEDRGGGLEEEKGLLGLGVVQLGDVIAAKSTLCVSIQVFKSDLEGEGDRRAGVQGDTHA